MLNNDALAQLRQLKQTIVETKDRATGIVKGSQGRFGFVALDDGREIYLPPEQMQRVFPDDRVDIEVVTGPEGKPIAQLERLLESPLRAFTGQYVVRDNAHFIETDLPRLSRWIFVPPKLRRDAKHSALPNHGDWVRAQITQHPFNDGKPQARIDNIIGNATQKGIEARYALARFKLPDAAPTLIENDIEQPDPQARRDLTALPLVTIDGAETRDMDDALHAERVQIDAQTSGWKLTVAIADPSAWIKPGSALEQTIAARGTSIYLPGCTVPMLPEQLANNQCSLQPDGERLALVCELFVTDDGIIARYIFSEARVRSCAKLSYNDAANFLRDAEALATSEWSESLHALKTVSECLQLQRQREHIVLPERGEYRAQLDENGKVGNYQRQQKSAAHLLVEECMVATNRCAADYLRDDSAIFVSHRGFRSERHDNVKKLIEAELPQLVTNDITALPNYIALMHTLATEQFALPLREILFRSLERSQFCAQCAPHFGMGLTAYTTITSPIRKFNDYLLHRCIKAKLRGDAAAAIAAETLAQLQDCSDRARQASNLAQQWLDCEYLGRQQQDAVWRAELIHVTSSGFVVRLLDNGIQGFVDTRHSGEKFSFDPVYMRLSSPSCTYQLEQQVDVSVAAIDMKKHSINFRLAKPPADADKT
ncbi:MAG TPA: VacB/RNase II family 3'-5' exoribonuclease [Spongiibacteraceae bacterium]